MLTMTWWWHRHSSCLCVFATLLFAVLAAPVRGDEIQYLPSGVHVVASVNFQDLRASKAFTGFKNQFKLLTGSKEELDADMVREIGIPAGNIARLTMGLTFTAEKKKSDSEIESEVGIVTTIKPVSAAAIIAARKQNAGKKNITFKEIKVGKYIVHEENFQLPVDKSGTVHKGAVFCVADATVVLVADETGGLDAVRKVLERNAKPELSKNIEAGLKHADFTNAVSAVIDLHGMPALERNKMFRALGLPDLRDSADSFQFLAVKANEKDKFTAQASLFCKNANVAGNAKTVIEGGLAELKAQLKDGPGTTPPFVEILKAVRQGVDAVKVAVDGSQASASVSVAPEVAGNFVYVMFVRLFVEVRPATKEEGKEKR